MIAPTSPPLTIKEAAAALRISPSLAYALCKRGKLRCMRHGVGRGTIRITEAALDEYRKAAEVQPPAAPADEMLRFIKTR